MRIKENQSVRRTNPVRRSSRLLDPKPPLRDFTKTDPQNQQGPRDGFRYHRQPIPRGPATICFGASPVASALDLRQERDFLADQLQTTTPHSANPQKPELSTWLRLGTFYFALTLYRPPRGLLPQP